MPARTKCSARRLPFLFRGHREDGGVIRLRSLAAGIDRMECLRATLHWEQRGIYVETSCNFTCDGRPSANDNLDSCTLGVTCSQAKSWYKPIEEAESIQLRFNKTCRLF
ncbi:hypothetical protein VFPPC_16337 [Pochonia chlamydosporia 170]|uniref:Uncharacterized protein n=1 Tax=Pochonia chlamydosporia 170 TaxID=1380566 RepID=A0A179FJE3_METCM|nr:hypothetical protein VFPPC_16337 [Pochonia chlamydosporia 170]OAQ65370.1 hypothetical protein VFPPC_16337 [Pochonia chlamydosporia 170]